VKIGEVLLPQDLSEHEAKEEAKKKMEDFIEARGRLRASRKQKKREFAGRYHRAAWSSLHVHPSAR
jgi:hypothetical protein